MRGWCCDVEEPPPPTGQVAIARMAEDCVALYRRVPPSWHIIMAALDPFLVDELVPEEEDVAGAVHNLRLNRYGGP